MDKTRILLKNHATQDSRSSNMKLHKNTVEIDHKNTVEIELKLKIY